MKPKLFFAFAAVCLFVAIAAFLLVRDKSVPIEGIKRLDVDRQVDSDLVVGIQAIKDVSAIDPREWRGRATRASSFVHEQVQPGLLPVSERLENLKGRASGGDNRAALELFVELENCATVDARLSALEDNIANEKFGSDRVAEMRMSIYENENNELEKIRKNCEGVSESDMISRFSWLEFAAASGDANAAYIYATQGSPLLQDSQEMFRNPEALVDFKNRARSYIVSAAMRCNIEALGFVGRGYETGLWFPADQSLGRALQVVAMRLSEGFHPGPTEGFGDEGIEEAADRIFQRYCL